MNTPTSTHLDHGSHDTREDGMCFIEAAAYLAGEKHSDRPPCVSRTIAVFGRRWNDDLSSEARNRLLLPLLDDVVGTGPLTYAQGLDLRQTITDWFTCTWVSAWLDLTPETRGFAAQLRAGGMLSKERFRALIAARDVARNAAWNVAESAAWDVARNAAWDAAENAAWGAAENAAMGASRSASRSAAALAVARHGPEVLAPVVEPLQLSAVEMLHGLCAQAKEMKNV